MAYLNPGPGSADEVVLTLTVAGKSGALVVPGLIDLTMTNANDIYSWSQLDTSSKLQVTTTATNTMSCNVVVDTVAYFGSAGATAGSAANLGLQGLSTGKTQVGFSVNMGTKTISGVGYIANLAPAVSASQPIWQSPMTIAVSGNYTVA
jgi:hypothetical protein